MPTAPKTAESTATLPAALVALQAELPAITKSETADAGTYTYQYADLAAITRALMPLLAKHGLAFTAVPTLADGKFELRYELIHVSGDSIVGHYPLPERGNSQQMGSAITYARRYALCSVTGVAPDKDDDDAAAASQATYERAEPRNWDAELEAVQTNDQALALYRTATAERAPVAVLKAIQDKGRQLKAAEEAARTAEASQTEGS